MVLVTSANGRVGRLVIQELVNKGYEIRALDINPDSVRLKDLGVAEIIIGDSGLPSVVAKAMEDIDQVVYIPPMLVYTESEMICLAIDESIKAGVKHFVMMSVCHANMCKLLQHKQKLDAEEHLKYQYLKHDLNFTILQPLHYCHNIFIKSMFDTGKFPNFKPLNKKLGYIDGVDVAEVTEKVLREGELHKYATYELCGRSHMSILEIAEAFTRISGKELETTFVEREHFLEVFTNYVGSGNDSYSRRALLAARDTYNDYGFDANSNVLEWLLGRQSTTVEDYIRRELTRLGAAVVG